MDHLDPAVTLPDGTHVLQRQTGEAVRPLFGRDEARTYVEAGTDWPAKAARTAIDGSYVANDRRRLLRSLDGARWTEVTPHL